VDRRNDSEVASRIATARAAKRLTQQQLAAAAAISASLLRKIERGVRPATPRVFLSIAEALDVDPGQLAGTMAVTDGRVHASIPVIRLALDMYDFPDDGPIRALPELGKAVATAQQWRLNSQYTVGTRTSRVGDRAVQSLSPHYRKVTSNFTI